MNLAQWFMLQQIVGCALGAIGFWYVGKPWTGGIWALYSFANIGWFMVASGRA
jgi:hypothetical protein